MEILKFKEALRSNIISTSTATRRKQILQFTKNATKNRNYRLDKIHMVQIQQKTGLVLVFRKILKHKTDLSDILLN